MRNSRTAIVSVAILTAITVSLLLADVRSTSAQASGQSDRSAGDSHKFIGTYRLVAIEQKDDKGQWVPTARSNSLGYILYDPTGHMAAQIMPRDRKKYAANEPTPDEARAALQGYTAYFGTFTVNEAEKYVIHHREGQLNPGGEVDAKRFYEFVGNRLILTPALATDRTRPGNNHLIWERLPDAALTTVGKQLVGFRRLVYTERTVEPAPTVTGGPTPQGKTERDTSRTGYIIYTSTGHMAVHIVRPDRTKYAGPTPTPEEAKAALQTYTSYFGRFTVDESGKFVTHHQDAHLNPGVVGSDAKRFLRIEGNRLTLQPPSTTSNGETATNRLTWELVPPVN
jgi:Lipocalin-like domain